jgi:hypothetical protein
MWYSLSVEFTPKIKFKKERGRLIWHEYVPYVEKNHDQVIKSVRHTDTQNAAGFQTFNVCEL